MTTLDGNIKFCEEWYMFYKSIKETEKNSNWLVDYAINFYEEKLDMLYNQANINVDDITKHNIPLENIFTSNPTPKWLTESP